MKLRQETVQIGLGVGIAFEAEQIEDVGFGQCRGDGVAAAGIERGIGPFAKVIGVETELDEAPRRRRGELVVHVQPAVLLAASRDGFCKFASRQLSRCTGIIQRHDWIIIPNFPIAFVLRLCYYTHSLKVLFHASQGAQGDTGGPGFSTVKKR